MKAPKLDKIDLGKIHKDLYSASSKVKELVANKATFLSVEGKGEPGGSALQEAIQKLYTVAYTTKFMLKNEAKLDFAVSKLECLWHIENPDSQPRSEWTWQLLIRIPDGVTARDLKRAAAEISRKRELDVSGVVRVAWKEGHCLQVMHVGSYDEVARSYQLLDDFARAKGLTAVCPAHEIYISDPRRVAPAKLKTIVRLAVRSWSKSPSVQESPVR